MSRCFLLHSSWCTSCSHRSDSRLLLRSAPPAACTHRSHVCLCPQECGGNDCQLTYRQKQTAAAAVGSVNDSPRRTTLKKVQWGRGRRRPGCRGCLLLLLWCGGHGSAGGVCPQLLRGPQQRGRHNIRSQHVSIHFTVFYIPHHREFFPPRFVTALMTD